MTRSGRSQDQINNLAHRQYQAWAVGDGAKVEFPLPKNVLRLEDVVVHVSGAIQQPSNAGTANAYAVRGMTPGYDGDTNYVKFTVAPPLNAVIGFIINAE